MITQSGNETRLPWTERIQEVYIQTQPRTHELIPADLFSFELKKGTKVFNLDKAVFRAFIVNKTWGTLLCCTEQEIEDCLKQIDAVEVLPETSLTVWLYVIEKKE